MTKRVALLVGLLPVVLFGQDKPCADYADRVEKLKNASSDAERKALATDLTKIGLHVGCFVDYAVKEQITNATAGRDWFKNIVQRLEAVRTDKQAGGSPASAGTTSVVSRGAAAKALSFAAEYGAMTQSVQGQVVTVAGNLAGVPSVLIQKDIFPYCDPRTTIKPQSCISDVVLRQLRRASFSVSFDTSRNTQTVIGMPTAGSSTPTSSGPVPATFRASGRELSSATARYELWNQRDVTSGAFQKTWQQKIADAKESADITAAAKNLKDKLKAALAELIDSDDVIDWQTSAIQQLIDTARLTPDKLNDKVAGLITSLIHTLSAKNKDFDSNIQALREASLKYSYAEDTFIDSIAVKPVLTFEYVNNRPVGQTSLSTFRLIFEKGAGNWNFAANGAFTIYAAEQPPINGKPTSRLRDAQAGGLAERKLGKLPLFGAAALDAAIYFQYQNAPAILNVDAATPLPGISFTGLPAGATTIFAEKGNIVLGQVRLVLAPGTTGARIPISFSGSNRTELINKPTWRAQVGISYDLDGLFGK